MPVALMLVSLERLLTILTLADASQVLPNLDALYTGAQRGDKERLGRRRAVITTVVRSWDANAPPRRCSTDRQEWNLRAVRNRQLKSDAAPCVSVQHADRPKSA